MEHIILILGFFFLVNLVQRYIRYTSNQAWKTRNPNHFTSTTGFKLEEPIQLREHFDKKAYLKSHKWQALRTIILGRDHHTCRKCGIDDVPLEVHHIHYDNLGDELPEDLLTLCRDCHQSIHDKYGYSLYGYYPIT